MFLFCAWGTEDMLLLQIIRKKCAWIIIFFTSFNIIPYLTKYLKRNANDDSSVEWGTVTLSDFRREHQLNKIRDDLY